MVIFLNLLSFASFGADFLDTTNGLIYSCEIDANTVTLTISKIKGDNKTEREITQSSVRDAMNSYSKKITDITEVIIEEGVTSIGKSTFSGCTALTTVTFKENSNLKTIDVAAFAGCKLLSSITIPSSVETIGGGAFNGCTSLSNIIITEGVKTIGDGAFAGCKLLSSITIPSSVETIGNTAFNNCEGLTTVTFKENSNLKTIDVAAFVECVKLNNIIIPSSVETIGNSVFSNCTELKDVYYLGTEVEWNKIKSKRNNMDLNNVTVHYSKMLTVNKVWQDVNSESRKKPELVLYRVYENCYKNGEDYYDGNNNKIEYNSSSDYVVDNHNETYTVYKKMVAGKTGKNDEYKQGNFQYNLGENGNYKDVTFNSDGKVVDDGEKDEWRCKILIYDNEEGNIYAVGEEPMEGYTSTAPTPELTTAP